MQNRPATNSILRPSHLRRPRDWACTKTGALHCLKCHAPKRSSIGALAAALIGAPEVTTRACRPAARKLHLRAGSGTFYCLKCHTAERRKHLLVRPSWYACSGAYRCAVGNGSRGIRRRTRPTTGRVPQLRLE